MKPIQLVTSLLVATFAMAPPSALASGPRAGSRSMDVTIEGAGGFKLRGTLVLPDAPGPAPAMLLLPGSGPTDRDGNQPPGLVTDLLKQLAERLSREGIATLRYDKRAAHVYAADWPKSLAAQNQFFAWANFRDDAKLAYRYLRGRPEVDPKRTGILGHSEGGIITLAVGAEMAGAPDRPAALVLAGTPGRSLADVLHNQIADLLIRQQAAPEQTKFFLDKTDSINAELIRTGAAPADVPPGLAALYPPSAATYLQAALALDPRELAKKLVGPVLVMNGEKDIQVLPDKDTRPLAAALNTRKAEKPVEVILVAGASHNLKPLTHDPTGFAGPVAPEAMDRLAAWLKDNLVSRAPQ